MKCIKISLLLLLLSFVAFPKKAQSFSSVDSAHGSIHAQITRDALYGKLSDANLKVIIEANNAQDKVGGEGLTELRRHFGDDHFASSLGYIDREKKRALNYAAEADTDTGSRGRALKHIGEMLHVVQDFYSRTNYLELMLRLPAYKSDPFNIPLVDWQKVPDGYAGLQSCSTQPGGEGSSERLIWLKDSPDTAGGKKVVGNKATYFQAARELAVRETQRQWNLFETMLRNRCGARSASVLAALKEASPELKSDQDTD